MYVRACKDMWKHSSAFKSIKEYVKTWCTSKEGVYACFGDFTTLGDVKALASGQD